MKLSISNIAWPSEADESMYSIIRRKGFTGLEIAPTRIFPEKPYDDLHSVRRWAENLKREYDLSVVSLQSIWYGRQERLFGSLDEKHILLEYTKEAIGFACAAGVKNLVFGCPKNRSIPEKSDKTVTDVSERDIYYKQAVDFFRALGDYAAKNGVVIGMEANPVMYNTNFINTTLDALALVKEVDSSGFRLNLDVGTMLANNEGLELVSDHVDLISHVHISEPGLSPIEDRSIHVALAEILSRNEYSGYVSLEMKKSTDLAVVNKCLDYVRSVFRENEGA